MAAPVHTTRAGRPRRSPRRALLALPLLLALLHLSASALAATHHHAASAGETCQACHAAHGAALPAPAPALDALPAAGRAAPYTPQSHPTVLAILLRVRGPPASLGAA